MVGTDPFSRLVLMAFVTTFLAPVTLSFLDTLPEMWEKTSWPVFFLKN